MKSITIIKDLIISILIVIGIVIILAVVFYDEISLGEVIPESKEYLLPEEMKKEMENKELEEIETVVVKYNIDGADLKKYETTKEYNKGKKNPFAIDTTSPETENINNDSDSEYFYEDDGTK